MINPFQAMQAMKNPMGMVQQQMLEKMKSQNPQMFNQVQQMIQGKNETQLKEMASDELKHANLLIKKAYSKLPSGEEKMKLKSYEDEIKVISEMM